MLFNSTVFVVFFAVVFVAYWAAQRASLRAQNVLLLVASYVFYGWWDYRFLALIFASSAVDYFVGMRMAASTSQKTRKRLLGVSLAANLGVLGVFKYLDFFIASARDAVGTLGIQWDVETLGIILPVGISFYTFQTLSYTIDIYRKRLEPVHDPVAFFTFVSFFPQLVAGPIERAQNLLPQFLKARSFDDRRAADGLRQALWGLFKKVVVADNLARYVDATYGAAGEVDGLAVIIATFFFAIQIYCDFSGYSDIAIGIARMMGFELMQNFATPYFSRNIGEFWKRWHISLSTWFRDYVYIPLGGSRTSRSRHVWNILVTFGLSGFWHGANWTFVVWGVLHALYYLPSVFFPSKQVYGRVPAEGRWLPGPREAVSMAFTFAAVLLAWVFFRADDLGHAFLLLSRLAVMPAGLPGLGSLALPLGVCGLLLAVEWVQRAERHALVIDRLPRRTRWAVYYVVLGVITLAGNFHNVPFIYFQF